MDASSRRYPVPTWITGALTTVALAVVVRLVAALLDVPVLVPDRAGGEPAPLELGPIVLVTLGAFAAAILAVLVLDRVLHGRSRRILRFVAIALVIGSLVPVFLADLPDGSRLVLTLLHLLVGVSVIRTVIREG